MFRRIVWALVLVLMLAGMSFGRTFEYGPFEIDVPRGWAPKELPNDGLELRSMDRRKLLTVHYGSLSGGSLEEFAQYVSERVNGTKPRYDNTYDGWRFTRMWNATWKAQVLIRGFERGDAAVIIQWAAGHGSSVSKKDLEQILDSISLR